jgi:ATP-dependent DNA ligase
LFHSFIGEFEGRELCLLDLTGTAVGCIQFSQDIPGDPEAIFRKIEEMGLEGVVSKKAASRYRSGPSKTWFKRKCFVEGEYSVLGVIRSPGAAPQALIGSLDGNRRYLGGAMLGLNRETRERFWRTIEAAKGQAAPAGISKKGAEWIRRGLVGRVRHLKGDVGPYAQHCCPLTRKPRRMRQDASGLA